jgi:hypothetical protein
MKILLAAAPLLALPIIGLAASPAAFLDFRNYLISGTPNVVVTADINNDNIPDVVVGTAGGTQVLLGKPDGTFGTPITAQPLPAISIAVADFDRDGNLDIASTVATNGTQVNLVFGNGNGTFQQPKTLPLSCTDCSLAAADFNGDGKMDLALANTTSVAIYQGTGRGQFLFRPPSIPVNFAIGITSQDLNGDGNADLVVTDFGAQSEVVLLSGRRGFTATSYPAGSEPFAAVLVDLNGDHQFDLASVDRATNQVLVRLNQGGGTFGPPASYGAACNSFSGCSLEGITAGDFNKDGKMDIATPGGVLYGNGNGTLQPALPYGSGVSPSKVASADFNEDGFSDLIVGNSSALSLSELFGGAQPVTQPVRMAAGTRPKAVISADFNHDGKADLAIAAASDNAVHILLGNGNGTFTPAADLAAAQAGALIAKDLNGDNKIDLAISGDSGTFIYLGQGDGTFQLKAQYPTFFGDCTANAFTQVAAPCFVTADFNNDSIPDLGGALWTNGTVSFLIGNGDGTFHPDSFQFLVNDLPQGMATGDFDKDGKADLAISSAFGAVYVYQGNGDGTFGTAQKITFSTTGLSVTAGDVDGDGNLDLVVTGGSGSSQISLGVWVIAGNGDLTFQAPRALIADLAPNAAVLADFNGDGKLDIAAANIEANDVSVLINNGGLTFLPETIWGAGSGAAELVAVDLNGDNKPEIVVINQFGNDLAILMNTTL